MSLPSLESSFRDPAGFVFRREGRLLRQVNEGFGEEYDHFLASGLYQALVDERLLVPHREVGLELAAAPGAHRVLEPDPVPFVSYPYEWCFGQLQDAALLTLRAQRMAMEHGMSLRDASAFNVQFVGTRPILIDTLSFERLRDGRPWVAYRQFCQHFLAPLAVMAHRDARLGRLWQTDVDGVPLDLAARLLPRLARLRFGLLMHVVLHGRSVARHANDPATPSAAEGRRFSLRTFRAMVDSLETTVRRLRTRAVPDLRQERDPADLETLLEVVDRFVRAEGPTVVWDLATGSGASSRLAGAGGANVVSFHHDPALTESFYRGARNDPALRLLPLTVDLRNPTPALGWAHRERQSLAERGPADLALALDLVHHLAIGNNVPLHRLASFFQELGRSLVIEFIPKEDPAVARLLAARDDVFPDYRRDGFERAFEERFEIERRVELPGSGRSVYVMRAAS